jgi:isopenicillin N synthase-like dioxygenase
MTTSSTRQIPTLDIGAFRRDRRSRQGQRFVSDLLAACHDPGFLYLTGHGIDPGLERTLFDVAEKFFSRPAAERESLAIVNSSAFRGYTVLGDEMTAGANDWRDQLDFGPEQEPALPDALPAWLRLRGPNQWPPSLPEMKDVVLEWMMEMGQLGLTALRALAVGLGQPINIYDSGFVPESDVHIKVIRYPGQPEGSTSVQGVGSHHDSGLLTFILQDSEGLQVLIDDEFVDAKPVAGAYVMNLGEMLQRATNGYLRATKHQVISPPQSAQRVSFAFFFNPRFEATFEPLTLPPNLAALAPGGNNPSADDPVHPLFGENNLKIRLRAHPDVAKRHYSDITSP